MSQTHSHAPRSWTEFDRPAKRRPAVIVGLFLLLVLVLVAFIWLLLPRVEQRVFAMGFSVEEFGEDHFPRPAFARWELTASPSDTWSPWLISDMNRQLVSVADRSDAFCEIKKNEPEVVGIADSIQKRFLASAASTRDTLIVYLRGLSLVVPVQDSAEPRLILLAPEETAPGPAPKGIALEELLARLTNIQAAQIVVLADIADLMRAPQIGIMENDIPSALGQAMQRLGTKSEGLGTTPVWLILPRGNKQPHHVSYLLKKTLLQSATEYALSNLSASDGQKHLSLIELYSAILRYSHRVTGGTQLPLLFRSGQAAPLRDENSSGWKEAERVHVAWRNMDRKPPEQVPDASNSAMNSGNASSVANETTWQGPMDRPSFGQLVSTTASLTQKPGNQFVQSGSSSAANGNGTTADQLPSSEPAGASNSQTNQDSPNGAAESSAAPTIEVEKDPWLRFWQLRDQLANRQTGQSIGRGWSPADFATEVWQRLQWGVLRKERLLQLSQSSTAASNMQRSLILEVSQSIRELEQTIKDFESNTSSINSGRSIPDAWHQLRFAIDSGINPQRPWLYPNLVADDLKQPWTQLRERLRQFMDVSCAAPAWMELYLEPEIRAMVPGTRQEQNELSKLRPKIERLIDQIRTFREQFVQRPFLLDRRIDFRALDNVLSINAELRAELDRIVSEYHSLLTTSANFTWQREKTIQTLLSSPLLSYLQRKGLQIYYTESESLAPRLRRPGHNNENYDSDKRIGELMGDADFDAPDMRLWSNKLPDLLVGSEPIDDWLRACFAVVRSRSSKQDLPSNPTGLILPVSSDTALNVVNLDSRHQLPNPLNIELRHRNGTSMEYCWFDWNQVGSDQSNRYRLESRLTGSASPLLSSTPHKIDLSRDVFSLVFRPLNSETIPIEGVPIQIRLSQQENELESAEPMTVLILPENPNRVDLFARRWDLERESLHESVFYTTAIENDFILRGAIRVPAVSQQAQAQYQFYLCNRSDKDRTIRARLFAATSPLDSGNGDITMDAISRSRRDVRGLPLLATVNSLELPGSPLTSLTVQSGMLPENAKPFVLPPMESGPAKQGNFGLLLIIDDAPPEGTSPQGFVGKPQYIWIDCSSVTPFPSGNTDEQLVQINPRRDQGFDVDFDVSVPDAVWNRWGMEKLDVNILITNERREAISNRGSTGVELSPKSTEATLSVRPDFDSLPRQSGAPSQQPDKILVHFSIGGYPRATVFEYRSAGMFAAPAEGSLWLDPKGSNDADADASDPSTAIQLLEGDKLLPVNRMGLESPSFVIPNRVGVTEESRGSPVKADLLSVPFRLDFPKAATGYSAKVSLGSLTPIVLQHDRQFDPLIDVVSGRLSVRSAAYDHRFIVSSFSSKTMLQDRQPLSISLEGTQMRSEISLIFDSKEPQPSLVELPGGRNLYEGGLLRAEIALTDSESDIREVYFAINRERSNELDRRYDDQDDAKVKASLTKDKWSAIFKHEALANAEILGALDTEYFIVVRSIDAAGNIQDSHRPASFYWKGKKKTK